MIKAEVIYKQLTHVTSKEVEGYLYNRYGLYAIIHKDVKYPDKYWVLTDLKSGYALVTTSKKKEIEEALLNKIEEIGQYKFYNTLNNVKTLDQIKRDGIDQHGNEYKLN